MKAFNPSPLTRTRLISARRVARLATVTAAAALLACTSTGPGSVGDVTAIARRGEIEITNATNLPVFTFVIGRNAAAVSSWMACADQALCPPLPPGGRRTEPYPAPVGGVPEREALVYWWHSARDSNGGLVPDSIRYRIVVLEQ